MPSPTHQNFVLLFRKHPELTFELARRARAPVADRYWRFEDAPTEFEDPLTGNMVRADLGIVGHVNESRRRGLIVEVQLDIDPSKEWTIELYRAGLRRQHKGPAWVVLFRSRLMAPLSWARSEAAIRVW